MIVKLMAERCVDEALSTTRAVGDDGLFPEVSLICKLQEDLLQGCLAE